MRKSGGMLHYYINGMDQGVAASHTPTPVWGVVDLYGMAVKVTIIDSSDPHYNEYNNDNIANVNRRSNNFLRQFREDIDQGNNSIQFSVPQIKYPLGGSSKKGSHVYFLLQVFWVILLFCQIVLLFDINVVLMVPW